MTRRSLAWCASGLYGAICVLPVLWLVATAFKGRTDITSSPPTLLFEPTGQNFLQLFRDQDVARMLLNGCASALASALATAALGLLSVRLLARLQRRRAERLLLFLLSTKMVPLIALSLPLYVVFATIGLRGTLLGLIVAQAAAALPMAIWLLRGFLEEVPREIEWAGQLDGLPPRSAFWRLTVPLAAPGIAATAVFSFVFAWNDYILASVLTTASSRPLTAALPTLITQGVTQWGQLCAGTTIAILPPFALATIARRYFVDGITAGTLKKL